MAEQNISGEPVDHRPLTTTNTPSPVTPYVRKNENGENHLVLMVDGVNCAKCIQKIEGTLRKIPQVTHARLNFSTRRLNLNWTGPAEFAEFLCAKIGSLGYTCTPFSPETFESNENKETRFLLLSLAVAGFAAGNIMLLSFAVWFTGANEMGVGTRDFLHWISALIAIPSITYAGRPFFQSAYKVLRAGHTNMDVPISVGLILTTAMSLFELVTHGTHTYFDSAVMLMFFLLIGRYLDSRARANAGQAARDLMSLMGGTATIIENGVTRTVLVRDLQPGMTVIIAMGERIPADCIIITGQTEIDSSLITGETMPVTANVGDHIASGTLNIAAPITARILRSADESQLASIVTLLERAEQSQAKYVRLADKIARLYTPIVHLLALITFISWIMLGHMAWQPALMIAVTVLIITCPCALALAIPVVQVVAISHLMKRGILIRSGNALERLAKIDTVIFDKTGTLTLGKPTLCNKADIAANTLQIAASMACHSRHPLAQALASAYDGPLLEMTVTEHAGRGLSATHNGRDIKLGRRDWCGASNLPSQPDYLEIVMAQPDTTPVMFLFTDRLRPDAIATINTLKQRGLKIMLLSGDRHEITAKVARAACIDEFRAGLNPDQKFAELEGLHKTGHQVLMVGDGLNDTPILAGADVSMAPASGIDIARNTASVVFTGDKLVPVLQALDAARFAQTLVRQNIGMTIIYNLLAIPLAMAGYVTPLIAALAMSSSSIMVTLNAFRIRRLK